MTRFAADVAYFLHQRPYRDNSAIVHFFTEKNGKVSFIVSGLKAKTHAKRPFLRPCHRLVLDYQLKTGLSKLTHIDFDHAVSQNAPEMAQFMFHQYANELLLNILPEQFPAPTLFADYTQFLSLLTDKRPHVALRCIELSLINLFLGLPMLSHTEDTQEVVTQDKSYYFYPERGLFAGKLVNEKGLRVDGVQCLAFQRLSERCFHAQFDNVTELLAQGIKPLSSLLIKQLLGDKVLKTRQVFRALQSYTGG